MKVARWSASIGSIVLFATGALHGTKFSELERMLGENHVKPPLDGISRASWLIFSTEMIAVAVIAFMASRMERGRGILFVCAATMAVNIPAALDTHRRNYKPRIDARRQLDSESLANDIVVPCIGTVHVFVEANERFIERPQSRLGPREEQDIGIETNDALASAEEKRIEEFPRENVISAQGNTAPHTPAGHVAVHVSVSSSAINDTCVRNSAAQEVTFRRPQGAIIVEGDGGALCAAQETIKAVQTGHRLVHSSSADKHVDLDGGFPWYG